MSASIDTADLFRQVREDKAHIKISLGVCRPIEYRESLGLAA
jgi:hypothetical protein